MTLANEDWRITARNGEKARRSPARRSITPTVGLTAKVLAPMTLLTLLCAALGGFVLTEEYKSYQANLLQKKGELVRHVRIVYAQRRAELLDVSQVIAKNPDVQNGLLIGDQYNALNTIMTFLGHSGIDIISLYDLDGRAFARAQSPSFFGDYDAFAPLVRSVVAGDVDRSHSTNIGVASYDGRPILAAVQSTRGVSGITGVVVVGYELTDKFLSTLVPASHTAIALVRDGQIVESTTSDLSTITDTIYTGEEKSILGEAGYQMALLVDDDALLNPFWDERIGILAPFAAAGIGSVLITFIFLFVTVVRPVRHLISVAEQQVSGDLSARAHIDSRDELGRLGDILNLLTGNLKRTLDDQRQVIAERGRAYDSLKKGEAQLQAIISGVPCPLAITRVADGTVVYTNSRFGETLGLSPADVTGRSIDSYFVDKQEYQDMLRRVNETGHVFNVETRLRAASGDTMLTMFSMRRVGVENSTEVLNAFFDITERKLVEDEVRQLNEELEARVDARTEELQRELNERARVQGALIEAKEAAETANISKSRFLAAASHDLRQPVHAMTLFVSNLAQQVQTPKAKETVAHVTACVESLCEMFEKILDVSKLASGGVAPQIQDFAVDRLFVRLQREFEEIAVQNGIEFRCVRSGLALKSDPALLHRILSNLVSNALKNTERGRVLMGCRRRPNGVEIQTWDTGVGISKSEIQYIFEEFYRGANPQEQRFGFGVGLGLGLSIVEHTANLLKHPIYLSSEPDRYTMFSVLVPYGLQQAVSQPSAGNRYRNLKVAGARVLVVDDHALALKAVQSTLESWGCVVWAANSSQEALQLLATEAPPQVLVVDYLLQNGETGLNLLKKVKNDLGLDLPTIVLSGVSSRLLEREVEEFGCRLIYKPVHPVRLRKMLVECLQRRSTSEPAPV